LVHFSTAAGDGCAGATIEARSRASELMISKQDRFGI
jgi:hypothetical protein